MRIATQPGGQPDAPIHGFYLASVGAARRLANTLGMPIPTSQYARLAFSAVFALLACVGAIQLFDLVLKQYVVTEFMERCIAVYPIAGTYVPFVAIAVVSGIAVGLVVGALGGTMAIQVAAWAASGVCALHFLTASLVGGVRWAVTNPAIIAAPSIAAGLLLGAWLGRKIWHA